MLMTQLMSFNFIFMAELFKWHLYYFPGKKLEPIMLYLSQVTQLMLDTIGIFIQSDNMALKRNNIYDSFILANILLLFQAHVNFPPPNVVVKLVKQENRTWYHKCTKSESLFLTKSVVSPSKYFLLTLERKHVSKCKGLFKCVNQREMSSICILKMQINIA